MQRWWEKQCVFGIYQGAGVSGLGGGVGTNSDDFFLPPSRPAADVNSRPQRSTSTSQLPIWIHSARIYPAACLWFQYVTCALMDLLMVLGLFFPSLFTLFFFLVQEGTDDSQCSDWMWSQWVKRHQKDTIIYCYVLLHFNLGRQLSPPPPFSLSLTSQGSGWGGYCH